jgi:uncharacterized membrane protein AbrB (regulator of aidB expression)
MRDARLASSSSRVAMVIIAASSNVDVPFVMAMQMTRFILVMLIGPTLARTVARWTEG